MLPVGHYARYDLEREARTGVPEVVLAEGKSLPHLLGIVRALAAAHRSAFISRPDADQREGLRHDAALGSSLVELADGRLLYLRGRRTFPAPRGVVAILTAGTADVPVAEEARAFLETLGAEVQLAYDVGVAGIHRLLSALRRVERRTPAVYLVFAGREGALPTVVAGAVRAPVIGVPTSVGYGRGGKGEAALLAMLQSCAPVAVVNIDAAIPAALFALQLIRSRRRRPGEAI